MTQFLDLYKHKGMRRLLVKKIKSKGISDPYVLEAIETVPRHAFLDNAFQEHAYQDKAFQIGEGQTISQPYTVAFQTELLQAKPDDRVLEIGTGSGYQCSILVALGVEVYSIEYNPTLHRRAKAVLRQLGYRATLRHGDGSLGWPDYAPYDGIVVTAGAPTVPEALLEQLADGGRLVIPVGDRKQQEMLRLTKGRNGQVKQESFQGFSFVPLLGEDGWNV
ncbi:MAG: protein-L-isoaspartate(D-aspartate) O-methyltransferase [Tunicatimonas sp.]